MDKIFIIILFFIQFQTNLQYSDNTKSDTIVDEFLIHFELTNDDEISLTCIDGCAWMSLKFTCSTGICEQRINQYGMADTNDDQNRISRDAGSYDLANFTILISRTEQEFYLECNEGCAWSVLNFNLSDTGHKRSVNQMGTTVLNE
ncbi:MAG: hypothetical protein JJU37_02935 [Balneolaceae bacterium]|nr:hypothetical protein [Balneolaceae bacterium]